MTKCIDPPEGVRVIPWKVQEELEALKDYYWRCIESDDGSSPYDGGVEASEQAFELFREWVESLPES